MPKLNPKQPWLHEASGFWWKKFAGKLNCLDPDYHVARRKLAAILAGLKWVLSHPCRPTALAKCGWPSTRIGSPL